MAGHYITSNIFVPLYKFNLYINFLITEIFCKFPYRKVLETNYSIMLIRNFIRISVLSIIGISLFGCKTEEVILNGDIKGIVTDAETNEPIQNAAIKVMRLNVAYYMTSTGNDGAYLLKHINPGEYDIQASKNGYNTTSKKTQVIETKIGEINFALNGIPISRLSDSSLSFELDFTSLHFTISNIGRGKLSYEARPSQDWITISPSNGELKGNETDTLRITINKSGLSDSILYKETIKIFTDLGLDTFKVIVNGLMFAGQAYKMVKIDTQTWLAENLNIGEPAVNWESNNGKIEKSCYLEKDINCKTYGALYEWNEMMQYNPSDTATIGTTRGICPAGWHIPTEKEWISLINFLGERMYAGGKLKESGIKHWLAPNVGATNEVGFTALPGGYRTLETSSYYSGIDSVGVFWTATKPTPGYKFGGIQLKLGYGDSQIITDVEPKALEACSVRCIKNP
jgi:uncharacterized protein (TIGR02145 family)